MKLFSGKHFRRPGLGALMLCAACASTAYWTGIASDRFVSQAHILVQRTEIGAPQTTDLVALMGGTSGARAEQMLLREHLLSIDMLEKLDAKFDLRAHYSSRLHDPISRLWDEAAPIEDLQRYLRDRLSIEFDDHAGVLRIETEGFDADMAHAITAFLVGEGERFMNDMAHALAHEQVRFLESQVAERSKDALTARKALLEFQQQAGIADPKAAIEGAATLLARLTTQKSELEAQKSAMQSYLVPGHANLAQIEQQIAALGRQLEVEGARMTEGGQEALIARTQKFSELEAEAAFRQDLYRSALTALEAGRIEATRKINKVSVLQAPTVPQSPIEPGRLYNTVLSLIVVFGLYGFLRLALALIKDHKD